MFKTLMTATPIKRLFLALTCLAAWCLPSRCQAQLPKPGDTLIQDIPFNIRFHDDPRREHFDLSSQAPPGYYVVGTELHVTGRGRDTTGPFIEQIAGNGSLFSESYLNEKHKEVSDLLATLQTEFKDKKQDQKTLLDLKARLDETRERMILTRNQFASSHSAVRVRGSAACTWKVNILGARWYTSGACLQGFVRVKMVYFGSDDYIKSQLEQVKKDALAVGQ